MTDLPRGNRRIVRTSPRLKLSKVLSGIELEAADWVLKQEGLDPEKFLASCQRLLLEWTSDESRNRKPSPNLSDKQWEKLIEIYSEWVIEEVQAGRMSLQSVVGTADMYLRLIRWEAAQRKSPLTQAAEARSELLRQS